MVKKKELHDTGRGRQGTGCYAIARVGLKRGKIDRFSMDLLVRLAAHGGLKPKLKLSA